MARHDISYKILKIRSITKHGPLISNDIIVVKINIPLAYDPM